MKRKREFEERIEEARNLLDAYARKSIEIAKQLIPSYGDPSKNDLLSAIQASLKHLGEGLHAAAAASIGTEEATRLNLYFWPGYETIHKLARTPRITFTQRASYGVDGEIEIPCGIGFFGQKIYYLSSTSVWFWAALTAYKPQGTLDSGETFIPGSTHEWLARVEIQRGTNRFPLDAFVVHHSRQNRTSSKLSTSSRSRSYKIALQNKRIETWAKKIASRVEDELKVTWPYVPQLDDLGPLREELYNIWLAANFWPKAISNESSFSRLKKLLKRFHSSHKKIEGFFDRIKIAIALSRTHQLEEVSSIPYEYWYSLRVRTVGGGRGEESSLGSAMILSSLALGSEYLEEARKAIYDVYNDLRHIEHSVEPIPKDPPWKERLWPSWTQEFYDGNDGRVPHDYPENSPEQVEIIREALAEYLKQLFNFDPPSEWLGEPQLKWVHEELKHLIGATSMAQGKPGIERHNMTVANVLFLLASVMGIKSKEWLKNVCWTDKSQEPWFTILPEQDRDQATTAIVALCKFFREIEGAIKNVMILENFVRGTSDIGSPVEGAAIVGSPLYYIRIVLTIPNHARLWKDLKKNDEAKKNESWGQLLRSWDTFMVASAQAKTGRVARCAINFRKDLNNENESFLEITPCPQCW